MRPSLRVRRRASAAAVGLCTVVAAGSAPGGDILVEVTAPAGAGPTAFVLACNGAVARHVTPARLSLPGPALDCEVRAEGPLEIVARSGQGSTARSRTSGGVVRLHVR